MLKFTNNEELKKIIEFQKDKPRRLPYGAGSTDEIGFVLVKDHGIYLMSPTDETMPSGNKKTLSFVSYARGYKPTKKNRETLWYKTHEVSGDDFAMFIHLTKDMITAIMHHDAQLDIKLTDDKVEWSTRH